MYEGLRLTELHEEASWKTGMARIYRHSGDLLRSLRMKEDVGATNAEIRARVAAQEIGPPHLFRTAMGGRPAIYCGVVTPLLYGIPDAIRKYPGRYDHWTFHARHAVPVEGCHLCREGRR